MRSLAGLAQRSAPLLAASSPFVLAGAAVVVAFALGGLYSLLVALRHQPGLTGQQRALDLFSSGSLEWAAILLFATGLVAARRPSRPEEPVAGVVLTGLVVSAVLATLALGCGLFVELTNFGQGIDAAFAGIIARLAAVPITLVAGWWAWQQREELHSHSHD